MSFYLWREYENVYVSSDYVSAAQYFLSYICYMNAYKSDYFCD